ncbi:MAG: hypothetical protein ACPGUV_12735, partial [Polyangiales bacterium]
ADPFQRSGMKMRIPDPAGGVDVPDLLQLDAGELQRRVAAAATVAVEVDASGYPDIEVRASVQDGSGAELDGIDAAHFKLTDEGAVQPAILTQNRARAPRLLIAFDDSNSVDAAFRSDDFRVDTALRIAEELWRLHPEAEVGIATIDRAPRLPTTWYGQDERSALASTVAGISGFRSDLWKALAAYSQGDQDWTVMVSDGVPTDQPSAEAQALFVGGPATVLVDVHNDPTDTDPARPAFLSFLRDHGGRIARVDAPDRVVAEVLASIRLQRSWPYRFRYRLRGAAAGVSAAAVTRQLRFALQTTPLSAEIRYTVPAAPAPSRDLMGLMLEVDSPTGTVRRVLAGRQGSLADLDVDAAAQAALLEAAQRDVQLALLGRTTLAFEGAAPPPSVWLDDMISAALAFAPLGRALEDAGTPVPSALLAARRPVLPPRLLGALGPVIDPVDDTHITHVRALRIAVARQYPRFGETGLAALDILHNAPWRTLSTTSTGHVERTMARSLLTSFHEGRMHVTSTDALMGAGPVVLSRFFDDLRQRLAPYPPARREALLDALRDFDRRQQRLLLPESLAADMPFAAWAVASNGSTVGILEDGSGGGLSPSAQAALDQTKDMIDVISYLGAIAGGGSGMIALFASIEKSKAEVLARAITALESLVTGAPVAASLQDDALRAAGQSLVDDALSAFVGRAGDAVLDEAAELAASGSLLELAVAAYKDSGKIRDFVSAMQAAMRVRCRVVSADGPACTP